MKGQKPRLEHDSYVRLLDNEVEVFLADGNVVQGVLVAVSRYALTLKSSDGMTIVNKAYLVRIKGKSNSMGDVDESDTTL